MNKIEEMAKETGYDGYHRAPFEKGFIRGANAVLREIEELTCLSGEALKIYLPRKIKELKGE